MPTSSPSNPTATHCYLLLIFTVSFALGYPPELEKFCKIVTRDEWGARPPLRVNNRNSLSPFLMVHHGGIANFSTTQEGSAEIVRSYQNFHMDDRSWDDIGYSFLIGEDGRVYEGRGWERVGAHAPQYNDISIGVCFLGDFSDRLPNEKALKALRNLIACSIGLGRLMSNYTLLGHRQARDTLCPGEALYKEITTWPHWKANPSPRMYTANYAANSAQKSAMSSFLTTIFGLVGILLGF